MSKKKKGYCSRRLAFGVAMALGLSFMSTASAASTPLHDMTSGTNADGILLNRTDWPVIGTSTSNPEVFLYKWDKDSKTLSGGDVTIDADLMQVGSGNPNWGGIPAVYVYASFAVRESDLPDVSLKTVNEVCKALTEKIKFGEGLTKNSILNYMTIRILDDDGNIIRSGNITVDSSLAKNSSISGGIFKQVLSNDGTADYYDIKQVDTEIPGTGIFGGTVKIPANTLYVGNSSSSSYYTIAPDLSKETLKAAVRGADKDLNVIDGNENTSTNIPLTVIAEGNANDTVYGIYNDKKGVITMKVGGKFNITATGNEKGAGIYAGNDADYSSKVVYNNTNSDTNNYGTITATGNAVEAGRNGIIELKTARTDLKSANGNVLYAHDGGQIIVGRSERGLTGGSFTTEGEGKYLALAETGGKINVGVNIEHLDSVDYDNITVYSANNNFQGNMKADDDSEINFGMKGTKTYTGDIDGNVNLYLQKGASWTGSETGGKGSLLLGIDSVWNINSDNNQHLKSFTGSEANSRRSYVVMSNGDITLDKYSGNTTFVYAHDASDPTKIQGGNITVTSAEPLKVLSSGVGDVQYMVTESPSSLYLQTSSDGIDTTDEASINAVLDSLAEKLTYSAYINGERNLSARAEIAEGLTSASISKYYNNLTFDEKTGNASTTEKLYKPYGKVLFGDETNDADEYGELISGTAAGGDLKYSFKDDTLIEVKINSNPGGLYMAAINNYGDKPYNSTNSAAKGGPSYTIDMNGKDLNVIMNAFAPEGTTGSQPMWTVAGIAAYREGTITIDNPGAINITSKNNYYYGSAIRVSTAASGDTGAHVVINNDNKEENKVTIRGGIDTPGYELNWRAIEVTSSDGTKTEENGNSVEIKGLVDIEVDKCASLFARGSYATIDIGGGRVVSHNYMSIWTAGSTALVNLNMQKDSEGNVIGAGSNYVQVEGDVCTWTPYYGQGGTINLGLATSDSYLKGHFYGTGNNNLYLQNGAYWENAPSITHNWASGTFSTSNAESIVSNLYGGSDAAHAGNILHSEGKNITVGNLSGYVNAYIGHEFVDNEDGSKTISYDKFGDIVIDKAIQTDGKNASISLFTDRDGIDTSEKTEVVNALSGLAEKLIYNEAIADENNPEPSIKLDGHVGISEGLTAGSIAIRLADLDFTNSTDGRGSLVEGSIHTPDAYVPIVYGDKETAMMRGAKTAMASSALMWRAENNDIMKRLGDLRLSEGENGIWAKYYGGKYDMDAQNTNLNLKYNAYQVGYDKKVGNGWTVGAALSYNDGDSNYRTGKAELKNTSVGVYGTWDGSKGQYLDLVAKYTRMENEFDVTNASGHNLNGDYDTWGASISAEYGKRFEGSHGFYVDPSVELTLGRINSKDYRAHSDFLDSVGVKKDMEVQQDAFTSLVGRLGVRLGQKTDNASYFAKVALAHEFNGEFDTTFRAPGEPINKTSIDFGDTWWEAQVGGTAKLSDNSLMYANFERSFGGDVTEKWRVDAGLRFSF